MCRLFGLHAGGVADAEFWLLDAPDSLSAQSHRNPDGAGIGSFGPDGRPRSSTSSRWPPGRTRSSPPAARDAARHARLSRTCATPAPARNTPGQHPSVHPGRPAVRPQRRGAGLDVLDRRLAELGVTQLVRGETDSERVFALITAETRRARRRCRAPASSPRSTGSAGTLPLYALNLVLATATSCGPCATRKPTSCTCWTAPPAARPGQRPAARPAATGSTPASEQLADQPVGIIASERMDDDPGWRLLEPGELLHVERRPHRQQFSVPGAPRHLLRLADLDPRRRVPASRVISTVGGGPAWPVTC